ncbi:NAD kinase 2, mitochondrial isoform X2 [Anarrhichthys ocellatus]|uniref:NAD kinase 2, mitochondrial isoform X2 n=1 Tax=Anarrhichthys ocellatus TaxID=433405 RepID=UPI0012EEA2E9|nr:NAD kinase 2, mitochondrial isoform X2 [Anarrhichthys ocellatus]
MDSQQRTGMLRDSFSKTSLLPIRSLNEIFIGESLSSRASYYEISVDDGPWEKQKSSGLSICTGTGSKAWSYNINKLAEQAVEEVLKIGKSQTGLDIPLNRDIIEMVTDEYNESLVFSPDDRRLFYSIREPIVNRVFSSSRQRGFASRVSVRSRCWDACMVVDGGTSFEFNDGAIATISMSEEDQLRTVVLEH